MCYGGKHVDQKIMLEVIGHGVFRRILKNIGIVDKQNVGILIRDCHSNYSYRYYFKTITKADPASRRQNSNEKTRKTRKMVEFAYICRTAASENPREQLEPCNATR